MSKGGYARMWQLVSRMLGAAVVAVGVGASAPVFAMGLDPAFEGPAIGPAKAKGVIVWSHGRSINAEDSESPSPAYLTALRDDGWDVMRFDRMSHGDTLSDSTKRLVDYTAQLKHDGYKQVILSGQSFGAFLSLMAADSSSDVDGVIATAPAAYGSFDDFYDSWRLNATRLYPLLERVKRARVMVFYFHGDDFDPGGRGERSRAILSQRGVGYAVVDQPAYLSGHWASSTGLFLRRYGGCIRDFANNEKLKGELACEPIWGSTPSAELKLPPELADPKLARNTAAAAAPTGSASPATADGKATGGFRDVWYGFYPNGREVLFGVETAHGYDLSAVYAIGPSVDNKHPAAWTRRKGRVIEDSFVFDEKGKSTLRLHPRQDGGLSATWISADGKTSMTAHLKPIDPQSLARRSQVKASAPVASAAAHGDGQETEE
jgi:pimeloyl-ACP methyl ester carboxylesterase